MKDCTITRVEERVEWRTLRLMGCATFATTSHVISSRGWVGWLACLRHLPEIGDPHPELPGMVAYKRALIRVPARRRRWRRPPRVASVLVFYEIEGAREWFEAVAAHFKGAYAVDRTAERLKGLAD